MNTKLTIPATLQLLILSPSRNNMWAGALKRSAAFKATPVIVL